MTNKLSPEEEVALFRSLMAQGKRITAATNTSFEEAKEHEPQKDVALQPFYTKVAQIASLWGVFEASLDKTLWTLAGTPSLQQGACLTAQIASVHLKLKALCALVHCLGGSERIIKKINRFSSQVEIGTRARNRAVHDYLAYMPQLGKAVVYRATADRKLDIGFKQAELSEFEASLSIVRKVGLSWETLITEVHAELRSLHEKQQ